MIASPDTLLGIGIYSPQEAAFYARVRTETMNRWLYGSKKGERVVDPQLPSQDEKTVTFLDFVQSLAVREIRSRHKIPLEKIREAVLLAKERGIDYPFARQHRAYLLSDGKSEGHGEIVLQIDVQMIQASGQAKRNLIMKDVAQLYLQDLAFSPDTGLAETYTAWSDAAGRKVVMNPKVRFGEPFVPACGYTAQTLWEAYEIEGGVDAAASAYEVTREDVELALRYYDHLLNNAAA
jgi:uncharacterized protein (DUF433 family)